MVGVRPRCDFERSVGDPDGVVLEGEGGEGEEGEVDKGGEDRVGEGRGRFGRREEVPAGQGVAGTFVEAYEPPRDREAVCQEAGLGRRRDEMHSKSAGLGSDPSRDALRAILLPFLANLSHAKDASDTLYVIPST